MQTTAREKRRRPGEGGWARYLNDDRIMAENNTAEEKQRMTDVTPIAFAETGIGVHPMNWQVNKFPPGPQVEMLALAAVGPRQKDQCKLSR